MPKAPKVEKKPESAFRVIGRRYPGLVAKIQGLIEESERAFAGNAPESEGSYLWEHTVHVASLAFRLAGEEKRDPLLASLTALFHDAGKFDGGRYHEGETAEEERAAVLAEALLKRARVAASDRAAVAAAVRALYGPGRGVSALADIVHDADFLSKFGCLGVAQFFIKSTLRGRTLETAVLRSLSKELTYAACLPLNMRTKAGREAARAKAAGTLEFYDGLLAELREAQELDLQVERLRVPHPSRPGRVLDVRLVRPAACPACSAAWKVSTSVARGKKCETLEARLTCSGCSRIDEISFCLPELA